MKVHSFESMAARDGDGIRLCVFLMGCPLRCVYCHNPDTRCGEGMEYAPSEIVKKAVRFKPYFAGGGGVTFSGGEPLLQSGEIVTVQRLLKEEGIGTVIDTSLAVSLSEDVKAALLNSELVLADLKFPSDELMMKYTGRDLREVLAAFDYMMDNRIKFRMRTVVVPGINDAPEALEAYLSIVQKYEPEYLELLPFHTLGFYKYKELGIQNPLEDTPPLSYGALDALRADLQKRTSVKIK